MILDLSQYRVKSPNSGCLLDIGNGSQSGPPLYKKAKGREAAHQFIMDILPVFSEFTQQSKLLYFKEEFNVLVVTN